MKEINLAFEMSHTRALVSKTSSVDGAFAVGAHLQLKDEDGNLVEEWISEAAPHEVLDLEMGKTYTLSETYPARGYVSAEDLQFTVPEDGTVVEVEMDADMTQLEFSLMDEKGGYLKDVEAEIFDMEGNTVENWISAGFPHFVDMLPVGEYVYWEPVTPKGYERPFLLKFQVMDSAELQEIVVEHTKTPETEEEEPDESISKTSGKTSVLPWFLLGAAGIFSLMGCGFAMGRKRGRGGEDLRRMK